MAGVAYFIFKIIRIYTQTEKFVYVKDFLKFFGKSNDDNNDRLVYLFIYFYSICHFGINHFYNHQRCYLLVQFWKGFKDTL
jgi:hypothetical protein